MRKEIFTTNNEDETIDFGETFAKRLKAGDIVSLYGELGAGKTEFIKGICQYFKVEEIVTSPTFTIINQYTGFLNGKELLLYHLDLYRIKSYKELDEIGFKDCMNSENSIKLIEWAENATDFLPIPRYIVTITFDDNAEDKRIFEIAYLC